MNVWCLKTVFAHFDFDQKSFEWPLVFITHGLWKTLNKQLGLNSMRQLWNVWCLRTVYSHFDFDQKSSEWPLYLSRDLINFSHWRLSN